MRGAFLWVMGRGKLGSRRVSQQYQSDELREFFIILQCVGVYEWHGSGGEGCWSRDDNNVAMPQYLDIES